MTCPDVGALRAAIDGEPGPSLAVLSAHLDSCPVCRSETERLRADAGFAGVALRGLAPPLEPSSAAVALARQRVGLSLRSNVHPTQESAPVSITTSLAARWRVAAAGLAAALALSFVLGTSEGRTAAAAFLAQFRSQTIQPIAMDSTAGRSPLAQLGRLGTVSGERPSRPETVASLAEASSRVGFAVKQPDAAALPAGLDRTPAIRVLPAHELRFTFDEAKARAYFAELGRTNVDLPARFNGATLVIAIPAAAVLDYRMPGQPNTDPRAARMLIVGQSKEITAGTEGGVSLDELRQFLLGLPGLPPDVTRQLRDIRNWQTTLPLPIPVDQMSWQQTTVAGGPGLVLSERTGLGTAAIWQRNGQVFGVAGSYPAADVQRVADTLR